MIDIRLPNINAHTEREQLSQVKSYLYQFAEQIQFAFNSIETSAPSVQTQTPTVMVSGGSSSVDAQATFNAVKGLIIKSADIINSYCDAIETRLSGVYVAESDFGSYAELTEQNVSATSKEIELLYKNIQTILTDIESLEYAIIEANAHIRSGILYYNEGGIPVYGLEVGQKNTIDGVEVFNKYARFTADRLSFYDKNDSEVAYISDYKLYIRNVEITYRFRIGGLEDTVMPSGDVVTRWVGGNG